VSVASTGEPQDVEVIREVTPFDLEAFRCLLVDFLERHRAEHFPRLDPDPVTVKRGRKYSRIFKGSSIYCFVVMATGEILKPESWRKPAKHVRGSIHNKEPLKCCGPYGVAYLR
jgi:hypothetical protein